MKKFFLLFGMWFTILGFAQDPICSKLEDAQHVLVANELKLPAMETCAQDSDCDLRDSYPGFYCGIYLNQSGIKAFDGYIGDVVYQTLESKFLSEGCRHMPWPCPNAGKPVCNKGICKGIYQH